MFRRVDTESVLGGKSVVHGMSGFCGILWRCSHHQRMTSYTTTTLVAEYELGFEVQERVAVFQPKGWHSLDAQLMAKRMPLQLFAKTLRDYCAVCQWGWQTCPSNRESSRSLPCLAGSSLRRKTLSSAAVGDVARTLSRTAHACMM